VVSHKAVGCRNVRAPAELRRQKEALLFLKKKKQKDFCSAGLWALTPPTPMTQRAKVFCALFFKKAPLAFPYPAASLA
jgi:hypothetical protein